MNMFSDCSLMQFVNLLKSMQNRQQKLKISVTLSSVIWLMFRLFCFLHFKITKNNATNIQ